MNTPDVEAGRLERRVRQGLAELWDFQDKHDPINIDCPPYPGKPLTGLLVKQTNCLVPAFSQVGWANSFIVCPR